MRRASIRRIPFTLSRPSSRSFRRVAGFALALVCLASGAACVPVRSDDASGPQPPGDLVVTGQANPVAVMERQSATLTATATGGSLPYTFRWDQNGGPVEVTLSGQLGETVMTSPFEASGRYVFRVVVTDGDGLTNEDFVDVSVEAGVTVELTASAERVDEGRSVTLTAAPSSGTEPYAFEWTLEEGPESLDLGGITTASFTTDLLLTPGDYVFRVTVRDALEFENTATVDVAVEEILTVESAELALAGEPVELRAEVEGAPNAAFAWTVTGGVGDVSEPNSSTTMLTTQGDANVTVRLDVTFSDDGESIALRRDVRVISLVDSLPVVRITTNFGAFDLELDYDAAPGHVTNFLAYVEDRFYDGVLFHRNACTENPVSGECEPFVLQGGGYKRVDEELEEVEPTRTAIESEADNGLTNGDLYTVALALSGQDPDSGRNQFFINLTDNSFLDAQGFTVFGRVAEGTDVIDGMVAMERQTSPIIPGEVSLPVEDVIMQTVRRVTR